MSRKGLSAVWRDTVRDSGLPPTTKLVAFVLSTYANGRGGAYPSRQTLALGSSILVKAVDRALRRLETAGFVEIGRSRGRRTNAYCLTLPETASELRRSEWRNSVTRDPVNGVPSDPVNGVPSDPVDDPLNRVPSDRQQGPERPPTGSLETPKSIESNRKRGGAARTGGAPPVQKARAIPLDECAGCGEQRPLPDDVYCADCLAARKAAE